MNAAHTPQDAPALKGLDPDSVRRVLVCQLRQIGDVLLATPSVRLLAERFPRAEIHFFTERKCARVLEHNPRLHTVWPLDTQALDSLPKELAWYWKLARQGWDVVVDFQQLPRIRWVVGFSRAPVRLSYTPAWYKRPLYTHTVTPLDGYAAMTKASVLRPLGIRWQGEKPEMHLTEAERAEARDILAVLGLRPGHVLVSVDPTHRRRTRRWPAALYGKALALAAQRDERLRFLLLHGPGEEAIARGVVESAGLGDRLLLPERILTLRQMAACIGQAVLHFGACSAPRHMAVALDTPSLAVLGSTGPAWTYPGPDHADIALGLPCQPCNKNACPEQADPRACPRCLYDLPPQQVAETLLQTLHRHAPK